MAGLQGIAAVIGLVGSAVTAVGTIAAGRAERQAAEYQAKQLDRKALEELAASQRETYEYQQNKELALSRQQAIAATSGLGATDPQVLELAGETAKRGRYQESLAVYVGKERKAGLEAQAEGARVSGRAAEIGARTSAAGTILGGIGSFFDKYGRIGGKTGVGAPMQLQPQYVYR
jgi:hypothetical protein